MDIRIESVSDPRSVLEYMEPYLNHAYETMYGDANEAGKGDPDLFHYPRGRLWAAYVNNVPAGIAGWTRIEDLNYKVNPHGSKTVELKRLFVMPDYRGLNLSEKLDDYRLFDIFNSGYSLAVGETGAPQIASKAVHSREPYTRTEPFGDFHDNPGSYFFMVNVRDWFLYLQRKHISAKYNFGCDK